MDCGEVLRSIRVSCTSFMLAEEDKVIFRTVHDRRLNTRNLHAPL